MYKDILLAVDLFEDASWRKALPAAVEYCQAFGATLHLLTVVPDLGSTTVAQYFPDDFEDKAMAQAKTDLHAFSEAHVPDGVAIQHIVAYGTIYEEIMATADKIGADLIVMASHRPALKDYLLGPNAARVVRHSKKSVLVVRE